MQYGSADIAITVTVCVCVHMLFMCVGVCVLAQ